MPSHGPRHDPQTIDRALIGIVLAGGNCARAARELELPIRVVQSWKDKHSARIAELERDHLPEIRKRTIADSSAFVLRVLQTEEKLRGRVDENVDTMTGREAAQAMRDLSVSKGISIDKELLLRGEPTVILSKPDPERTLKQLAETFGIIVDSTAEDITDQPELEK
jgi:hypothetical protein